MANLLDAKRTVFCLCDLQEKFAPVIDGWEGICENASRLCEGSRLLEIPLIVSEQYPKGLGNTVPQIPIQHAYFKFEKTQFSMANDAVREKIAIALGDSALNTVEAHVCVLQTALALKHDGCMVHVVVDAVSSRNPTDRKLAYRRLENAGVVLSTTEMVLFELLRGKEHPRFREVQALVKNIAPNSNLMDAL